ncbi:MAG: chromate resistance protein [Candidatus Bathyarchaeota archaeon]|nr:chromate resistance protein [Candidatus Bathyarchaeota archaeon]
MMRWVTREHVHVDRVASPWLIKKFVDPTAEFIFVPAEKIGEVVETEKAIPFDVPNVELGHKSDKCTFDAIIEKYKFKNPALLEIAKIVRAADTTDKALAPESIGLKAIAAGSMMIVKDDFEAIEKQKFLYDSLYAYCKLRLVKERYKDDLDKMDRKQRFNFLRKKTKK